MNVVDEAASSGPEADAASASMPRLVVTIDGPAGTGKSSVARRVAQRLGLEVLDTGAMYRAVALVACRTEVDPADEPAVLAALDRHPIGVDTGISPFVTTIDGTDPGDAIRSPEVEAIVSIVAALPGVRARLVELQRSVGARSPRLVTEGRDQGSVVFPDATVRFYLTASADTRADRRVTQIRARGGDADRRAILAGIESRDRLDASRQDAPLVRPDGAVTLDTDRLTLDEVVERLVAEVHARASAPGDGPA